MSKPTFMSFIKDPDSSYSVVFEDDGKVAYAYLRNGTRIVADVWVYNCGEAPAAPEWTQPDAKSRMPFANPATYVRDEPPPAVVNESDISCRWVHGSEGLATVDVLIHGSVFARLKPGSKPGWSRLASRDGPNARVLEHLSEG